METREGLFLSLRNRGFLGRRLDTRDDRQVIFFIINYTIIDYSTADVTMKVRERKKMEDHKGLTIDRLDEISDY